MDVRTVTPDPRLLHSTAAIPVCNGVIGNANGNANDTVLLSVIILLNAGPGKLTITGFRGEDGVARNILLTGSATADTQYTFPGLRNTGAAMTLTATVADVVLVSVAGA
jgi:hypothetical protein